MSSVISANRRWEGRICASIEGYGGSFAAAVSGFVSGEEGFKSESIFEGEMELLMFGVTDVEALRRAFGAKAVARDMSKTSMGRICLPSDWV